MDGRIMAAAAFAIASDTKAQLAREEGDRQKLLFSMWHASNSQTDMRKLEAHEQRMQFRTPFPRSELHLHVSMQSAEREKEEEQAKEESLFRKAYDAWLAAHGEENTMFLPGTHWPDLDEERDKAWNALKRFQADGMTHAQAVFVDDVRVYEQYFGKLLVQWPGSDPVEFFSGKAAGSQTGATWSVCSSVC